MMLPQRAAAAREPFDDSFSRHERSNEFFLKINRREEGEGEGGGVKSLKVANVS